MAQTSTKNESTIHAALTFAVDTGVRIVNETMGPGDMSRRRTGVVEERMMPIRNGRALRDKFELEIHGFEFVKHPTAMVNFFDENEVLSVYYEEAAELIRQRSGAKRIHVFDHTLRSGDEKTRNERHVREPVTRVHNDYTEWSGPNRVRDLLPNEAEGLLERRFAIVQVWRAIRNPIEADPLAICDARTLTQGDLVVSERRYPDRIGQTYQIAYSPDQEWYYFPKMTRNEAVVFKVFDSATDGRARFTAHTAFVDPMSPVNAGPRESIEMRALVFF
ncbi:MAG: CmcJ/NvfI family oxidoreductase [Pseudomonadota bacterium]|nr:CmcJ/NvfI family oxidoreductase [Pseudomonadota bacterium]